MWKWLENLIAGPTQNSVSAPVQFQEITLGDVVDRYDLVNVVPATDKHGAFMVVTPKGTGFDPYDMPGPDSSSNLGATNPADFFDSYRNSEENTRRGSAPVGFETGPFNTAENNAAFAFKETKPKGQEPRLAELGSSEPSPYTAFFRNEYNRDLQGLDGLRKYDVMRKSDGVVSGLLLAVKTPVMAGRWFIKPVRKEKKHE